MIFAGVGRGGVSVLSRMVRVILTKQRLEGWRRGGVGVLVNKKRYLRRGHPGKSVQC